MADASGQGGVQGGGAALMGFVPFIAIFAIFYFLLIRPQQKQAKTHKEMLNTLKIGDQVIMQGGLHGKIAGVTDTIITLEIAKEVKVKAEKSHVLQVKKD